MTKKIYRELHREFPFAEIVPTKGGHVSLRLPNGRQVFTSMTPSDWRTAQQSEAPQRQRGVTNSAGSELP